MNAAAPIRQRREQANERWHEGWDRWVAANLLKGCRQERLIERLVANGFDPVFARQRIEQTNESPILRVARDERDRSDKLSRLLNVIGELQKSENGKVDRHLGLSVKRFYRDYVIRNRPVVLDRAASAWPAIAKWNLSYFARALGDAEIAVTAERSTDPRFEDNFTHHVHRWPFSRFAAAIAATNG